jgi:hypothetical protein
VAPLLKLSTQHYANLFADDFVTSHRAIKHQVGDAIDFAWSKDVPPSRSRPILLYNITRDKGASSWIEAVALFFPWGT